LDCGGKRSATPLWAKMARKVISLTAPAAFLHSAFYFLPSLRRGFGWLCPAFDSAQADTCGTIREN
jgi:hypothetical protein